LSQIKKLLSRQNQKHYPQGKGCNIVGLIRGSDPELRDEVILVSGHIDGVGDLGDELVVPGSYDNASAVAVMLGAARAMALAPEKPKRSVLFIFVGAEESALVGSRFYCENPIFPKEKTVCLFNMDMVGVGAGLSVSGGKSYPLINKHFEAANKRFIHRPYMATEAWTGGVARPRRDSVIFNRAGYHTLEFRNFVPEGETRSRTYYHHPKDDVNTLEPEVMEDLTRMVFCRTYGNGKR
jgi:Zn-dependent M28 family amino/carboxypeptidase